LQGRRPARVAFIEFYRRYERLVAGWLVRRTGDAELAADLTAEVFAAAYLAAPRFRDGPEPAGAWLLGIARNKLLKSRRQARAETSSRRRLAVERIDISDAELVAVEELRDVGAVDLLDGLPEDQRAAVRARILDESGYDEIARAASVSPAVARKRVSRGLATLRRRLEERGTGR
jgi:RNA polymerase sigma-70 factor (ECF subfamily)